MEDKKGYSFELHEDMLSLIEKEFLPQEIAEKLAAALKGKTFSGNPGDRQKDF